MSQLNLNLGILSYDDSLSSNNPSLRFIDWKRSLLNIPVANPQTLPKTVQPSTEVTIFDATISTTIDNTSAFSLTLSGLDSTLYRITNTGGTAPGFRTARSVTVASTTMTVAVLSNNLVTFTSSGTPFGAVTVGDTVFIPGLGTGDSASPFNALNIGLWTVISATSSVLTLSRFSNDVFSAFAEGPTSLTANSQFQVYSSAGVQVGDTVDISGGFQVNARKAFAVISVTASRVEIRSIQPLATETGIVPTTTNINLYSSAKRFVHIETDQDAVVHMNNDSGNTVKMSPLYPADKTLTSVFFKIGTVWKLSVLNKATVPMNLLVWTAE